MFLDMLSVFNPHAKLEGIPTGLVVSEQTHDQMVFTRHPVQTGAPVTDHAFKEPVEIHLEAAWGSAGVVTAALTGFWSPNEVYQAILDQQVSAKPFHYMSEAGMIYKNMVIRHVTRIIDKETYSILALNVVLHQIIMVDSKTVAMPKDKQQTASETASTTTQSQQQTKPVTQQSTQQSSVITKVFNGIKGLF